MSLFNATRLCLLCSYRSIEVKQFGKTRKGEINAKTHQITNSGLVCPKCDGFVCHNCISFLVPTMKLDSKHFQSTELLDHYSHAIAYPTSTVRSPPNYIGHCCLIEVPGEIKNSQKASKYQTTKAESSRTGSCDTRDISSGTIFEQTTDHSCSSSSATTSHGGQSTDHSSSSKSSKRTSAALSGCIFYPEFNIFIDSPFDCVDVHALGEECSYKHNCLKRRSNGDMPKPTKICNLNGRWHCVIPDNSAIKLEKISPSINGKIPSSWKVCFLRRIKVKTPHTPLAFQVRWFVHLYSLRFRKSIHIYSFLFNFPHMIEV